MESAPPSASQRDLRPARHRRRGRTCSTQIRAAVQVAALQPAHPSSATCSGRGASASSTACAIRVRWARPRSRPSSVTSPRVKRAVAAATQTQGAQCADVPVSPRARRRGTPAGCRRGGQGQAAAGACRWCSAATRGPRHARASLRRHLLADRPACSTAPALRLEDEGACSCPAVKDIDIAARLITVRHGKGGKDRRTMLPTCVAPRRWRSISPRSRSCTARISSAGFRHRHLPCPTPSRANTRAPTPRGRGSTWLPRRPDCRAIRVRASSAATMSSKARSAARRRPGAVRDAPHRPPGELHTPSAIPSPRTCWKPATTSAPCKNCSATKT